MKTDSQTTTDEIKAQEPAGVGLGAPPCSAFLREAVEKQLAKLRANCAVKREIKRNAYGKRWALAGGPGEASQKYWDDRQAEAQRKSTEECESADKALSDFIAEHRRMLLSRTSPASHLARNSATRIKTPQNNFACSLQLAIIFLS